MKPALLNTTVACVLCLFAVQVAAQPTLALAPALTHQEQAAALNGITRTDKAAWMRGQVLDSRYGQRGLDSLFKGFEGKGYLDPAIPGVTKNLNALSSLSQSQAKGAVRTLLYATKAYQDPRFQLVGVDQPVNAPYGRTDKDLVLRHRQTGQRARVEVKDVKPASQRSDLERIKGQIDKMAAEYKRTGELQAWVNRRETIVEIKEYARQNGIAVYDNAKQQDFRPKVLDQIARAAELKTTASLMRGAGELGMSVWLLTRAAPETLADFKEVMDADTRSTAGLLQLGDHGALSLSAISGVTAGTARMIGYSRLVSNVRTLNRLGMVGKWGGRAGVALFLVSEGFVIAEWQTGALNDRQFYTMQSSLGGGLVGGASGTVVGAWIGGGLGVFGGPFAEITVPAGTAIGGFVGGLVGGFSGATLGEMAATSYYSRLDENQKQQVAAFIYQHYGVRQ